MVFAFAMMTLAACSREGGSNETNGTVGTTADAVDPYPDYLKDKTYDGATVRLLVATESYGEFFAEEDSENNMSVAIYNRNLKVMDRHEVEIEYVPEDGPVVMQNVMLAIVQGGDQSYDIFAPSFWWNIGNEGIAANLADIELLHFDQPWWYQGWNDALTYLDDSMYYCTGAVNLLTFNSNSVIFMNKGVFEDISVGYKGATVEDIQQLVLDGLWTKEVLLEYVKLFGADLDHNNVYDEHDAYGHITGTGAGSNQLAAWDVSLTFIEAGGEYEWNFFTKGFIEKYEEYGNLLQSANSISTFNWEAWPYQAFGEDRVLFATAPLNCVGILRQGDADYTILPLTKYNEAQKEYRTLGYGAILNAIPGCLIEVDRAAVILEALNYESYQSVMPEFKENTLKNKIANDEGTKKMLDVIYDSTTSEFAFVHSQKLQIWGGVMGGTNPNIASAYFSNEKMYNQLLNDILYNFS